MKRLLALLVLTVSFVLGATPASADEPSINMARPPRQGPSRVYSPSPAFFEDWNDKVGSTSSPWDRMAARGITASPGIGARCGGQDDVPYFPVVGATHWWPGVGGKDHEPLACIGMAGQPKHGRSVLNISTDSHWNTITIALERGTSEWDFYVYPSKFPGNYVLHHVRIWNQSNGFRWGWETVTLQLDPALGDWIGSIEFGMRDGALYLPMFDDMMLWNR